MNSTVYYLQAKGAFHFGEAGVGVETSRLWPRADTLFAALCLELRALYGEGKLNEFLNAFPSSDNPDGMPPLLLSSAFPYLKVGGHYLRFYPRPLFSFASTSKSSDEAGQKDKSFKKFALVSESLFTGWVRGDDLSPEQQAANLLQNKSAWVTTAERQQIISMLEEKKLENLWQEEPVPRVTIDRASSSSQIFHSGRVRFAPDSGLWLAICWLDASWREAVETALASLADAGLGGERSAGYGQFTLIKGEDNGLPELSGKRQVTLAPYHPTQAEVAADILGEESRYALLLRRGWLGSPENGSLRHQTVRLLAEGSCFVGNGRSHYGDLVNVTPANFASHPVYRYGLAFPIGVAHHE